MSSVIDAVTAGMSRLATSDATPRIGQNRSIPASTKSNAQRAQVETSIFDAGSVGWQLFPLIRPYLDVSALVQLSKTSFAMNQLARTYTVKEILTELGLDSQRRKVRVAFAALVRSTLCIDRKKRARPQRISQGVETFWANVLSSRPRSTTDTQNGWTSGLGDTAFDCIQKYLTATDIDLLVRANVIPPNHTHFRLLSLDDILAQEDDLPQLTRSDRISLGIDVRLMVTSFQGTKRLHRIVDGFSDRSNIQYVFQPAEHDDLIRAVETC